MTTRRDHEQYEILLVKAVDGLLSADEEATLQRHLDSCETCRAELKDFTLIKETTDAMTERILLDADIEPPRESAGTRASLGLGFVLVFAGLLILMGFGCYELFTDPEVPTIVKVGAATAGVGTLILFIYVIRVRMRGLSRDPYREIDL